MPWSRSFPKSATQWSARTSIATEAQVLDRIDGAQILRKHILYVERDASVNYLDAVRGMPKQPWYTVGFRNQAPTVNSVEILQLASGSVPRQR